MKLRRVKEYGALKCPYCRDPIYPAPSIIRCLKCKTIHHEKCWEDRGNCSVYGCKGTPQQELTDFFYIELFQKRRKKLFHAWISAAITSIIISFIFFHLLKPVLPAEGRLGFSFAVVLFLSIVIVLAGFAQYLCPACGYQPRIKREPGFWEWYSATFIQSLKLENRHKLLLNPTECPHCHVRLRSA